VQVSPNFEERAQGATPRLIVLHYTGMASGQAAVDWLCNPDSKVSCHYLIDDDGCIVQMVDERHRAWHAGVSSWQGVTDINSTSIGIEIQNPGHAAGCPVFPMVQMQRVAMLCLDILSRYDLSADRIVAHSDVAPGRKVDPGEAFDWGWLHGRGLGQVVNLSPAPAGVSLHKGMEGSGVLLLQQQLARLGYSSETHGRFDDRTHIVVEAFQRRFRRVRVDGVADAETKVLLQRLIALLPLS
jgi:N-acetylmuramoyl-L-alanine amidase